MNKGVIVNDNFVVVTSVGLDLTQDETIKYAEYVDTHAPIDRDNYKLARVIVTLCDDGKVDVDYDLQNLTPFERIRRITGYLTGNLNTWNDAKRAEESERVKHTDKDGSDGWFNSSGRQFKE